MPRSWQIRLEDMFGAIARIEAINWDILQTSDMAAPALERAFEILSEASRYIPADIKARYTSIRWQDLADLGNQLRHVYHRIAIKRLWDTAQTDIPALKAVLQQIQDDHA